MSGFSTGGLILTAASATASGEWIRVSGCEQYTATVRVSVTAATLSATLKWLGSDFDTKSGSEAVFTGWSAGSALPGTITLSGGVWTFANVAIGTTEFILTADVLPRFVQPVYTFASGGGTVALNVGLSCW